VKVEDFTRRLEKIAGWDAEITTYRIGDTWHCHVDNVSPGATVARADGETREAAEREALTKAEARLGATRRAKA
jgi:hypothetical protein